jgi:hypothetical protein
MVHVTIARPSTRHWWCGKTHTSTTNQRSCPYMWGETNAGRNARLSPRTVTWIHWDPRKITNRPIRDISLRRTQGRVFEYGKVHSNGIRVFSKDLWHLYTSMDLMFVYYRHKFTVCKGKHNICDTVKSQKIRHCIWRWPSCGLQRRVDWCEITEVSEVSTASIIREICRDDGDDWNCTDLWNVGKLIPVHAALQPNRLPSSQSPPRELQNVTVFH